MALSDGWICPVLGFRRSRGGGRNTNGPEILNAEKAKISCCAGTMGPSQRGLRASGPIVWGLPPQCPTLRSSLIMCRFLTPTCPRLSAPVRYYPRFRFIARCIAVDGVHNRTSPEQRFRAAMAQMNICAVASLLMGMDASQILFANREVYFALQQPWLLTSTPTSPLLPTVLA